MTDATPSTIQIQCDRFSDILVLLPKLHGTSHLCGKLPDGLSQFANLRQQWMTWFDKIPESTSFLSKLHSENSLSGKITSSSQINSTVARIISSFAGTSSVYPDFLEHLRTTAYELLQNAVFCAPVDATTKTPKYLGHTRAEEITLTELESPSYIFHEAKDYAAIGVHDSFGRLEKKRIIRTLAEAHTHGVRDASSADHSRGAGIGLHMVLTLADHTMIRVIPNKSTEIISFFWKYRRRALFEERVQSLSLQMPS